MWLVFYNTLYYMDLFFAGAHCLVGEGAELHGLVSCINKYNWLCVLRWGDREAKKTRR